MFCDAEPERFTDLLGLNFIQQLKIEVQRTDSNANGNI
jgi:hypothetical protein